MMFSAEKCSDRSMGTSEEKELQTGGGEGLGKEGVPPDEVASAVAAVSEEIGDILKDELGDADRADRIGAELAGLSAELGLLAGLADGEPRQNFPTLFEMAIGHRGSASGTSSSSSWSGARARPQRQPRRRPIAKGKEISRRRSAAARRAASMRVRRIEVVSDASDVGADSDSDGQWTELEDACTSDNSSSKEQPEFDAVCNGYENKAAEAEPPSMGQFLLPLLSAEPERCELYIRHEDILQAVRLAPLHFRVPTEDCDGTPLPPEDDFDQADSLPLESDFKEPPVTPEEEAALLKYVTETQNIPNSEQFTPVPEWLLGVYHAWCEISALMYTLLGANMSVDMVREDWVYRARFGCHCRLCLCLANNAESLARWLLCVLTALHADTTTVPTAVALMRALNLPATAPPARPVGWRLARLKNLDVPPQGLAIIYEHLLKLEKESEMTRDIVNYVCVCRPILGRLKKKNAMERLCMILENFKAASVITFEVDILPSCSSSLSSLACSWRAELGEYLRPLQRCSSAARLRDMLARAPPPLNAWTGYKHKCDCLNPRAVCAQQRKMLLRISFFGMMQGVNEISAKPEETVDAEKAPSEEPVEAGSRELQQGDGTGAKPPDNTEGQPASVEKDEESDKSIGDLDDLSDSDGGSGSLGLSSSSLDSASELLLAAAAAVESGSEDAAAGSLCRTVRHLMRSIAHIERLMDRVLKHCDEWPGAASCRREADADDGARKKVDLGLSEVDRKLMAMYRRLPDVHRRQLQLYRKQKKLSTVCMQLVGGRAPAPPPPGSPPPAPAHQACRALCPEYHLRRFQEVRRKVMHMRDQQLYYHRLRMWLEEQLRYDKDRDRDSLPDSNSEDAPRSRRLSARQRRKLSSRHTHRILQLLRQPPHTLDDDEVDPPEAFPLSRDDTSGGETVVGERDELCREMRECLAKFADVALGRGEGGTSPPLQEMSPTSSEPPKPNQRLLQVNKYLPRDDTSDFQSQTPELLNAPINARRPLDEPPSEPNDPNVYRYVAFGMEINKAMEECQNIINSYNSINDDKEEDLSLTEFCEAMMNLDTKSSSKQIKADPERQRKMNSAYSKLVEVVENMPQILANMPEVATKLKSDIANAAFELPEFASIMNSLPEVNNEAQLTPETLKQIRELKLSKNKDNVKVTKNTAKRKANRRIKNNINHDDILGTMTLELDSKDINDLLKDDNDLHALMKSKSSKDDFKDLLFSISAQVVINKVFEYLKQNKSPELAKCLEEDKDLFNLPKSTINSEMYSKASTLFDNSVKDALSMDELRELVKTRFISWKQYVATKFRGIPVDLLEKEIEAMLDKFYIYIKDLAGKQNANDSDKIIEKIEELQESKDDNESKDPKGKSLLSFISPDEKMSVKSLKFKYMDVIKLCTESAQLTTWILLNPEMASNVIEELTGLPSETVQNVPDFSSVSLEEKKQYFINRLKAMNKTYMETLPKEVLSGDEWLVMLYRLENLEGKIRESLSKVTTNPKLTDLNHADFLLYKAIGIIIYDIKNNDAKPEEKQESLPSLLPSFNAIKSYITQGQAMSETHKNEIVSICSSINTKLIDETVQESKVEDDKEKPPLSVVGSQNPELLAKYSAQALRNAKQTLNEVAFRNMMRNGQTKSESDACDTPKSDCKWTNDCVCNSCKDDASVCTEKHVFDDKKVLEEKKEVKPAKTAAKAKPKVCENASHQQHVCKVGHANGPSACAGEGAPDSPCTCCYCTVFGHAPPLTTPVPRNFNETRERLRSILNKKKQKCKTNNATNGEPESPTPEPQPPRPKPVPAPPAPKPPFVFQALPKTLPPAPAPPAPAPAPAPAPRPEPVQRPPPMQVNVQNTLKTEGKVNPAAMEQIRLQQLKIQQMQAQQWSVPQPTAQHKPEPIYDLPIHNKPPQPQQQTQQTLQQQQQQLLQQLQQKQRMSRPAQPRAHASVSSRDTSVFSTSSGCSGITSHSGSCWRGHQDPRDLDALLQYIEGPARRVDRGKKRAKKLRQKGKKLEARLLEEHGALAAQLNRMRAELRAMQARQAACVRQCAEAEAQLRQQQAKRKGKKQKMNPAQQAQAQLIAEKLGELNALNKLTAKEVATAERQVADFAARFEECERQLAAARALQGAAPRPAPAAPAAPTTNERHLETATMLHRQQLQLQQQQLQQQFANLSASDKMDKQKQKAFLNVHGASARRNMESAPVQLIHNGRHLTVLNANIKPPKPQSPPRKQTWEQALAHINQLAKGSGKEKKKQKEPEKPKVEPKKPQEPQRSQSLPDSQPLSKKQRKLLAKQQAEEEERKRQQQLQQQQKAEARAKKEKERKPEPKPEPKRAEKPKKTEPVKEEKSKKKEKKEKQERTAPPPVPAPTPKQTKQQTKKEKKEQNKQNQVINITADTTIEVVNKKGGCGSASETPSSCSIMEQLSCGVQVSDLRLPPGITLTRVQPNEKKEPPPIKSVPLWKAGALPATPTPVARPAPVINADPSMMMFSAAQPEQPKTIILPEPAPPQPGRSKKAKKKAKKTAAAEAPPKPEPTKMVTLRNPMFHPNLPPANPVKKPEIRIPDPIPMPPNACQATITPTSNGMYTIRNPLMSMMHQQNMMGMNQQQTPMYGQQYNYVNPNTYTPVQTAPTPQAYVLEQRNSPKQDEFQNRIMNLASFTQKNEEGYSLFKTSDDNQQRNFLTPEYYMENSSPKPTVSPNPIGTRPNNDSNRSFDSNDSSLFTNPIKPEPIGTPLKQENDYAGLYTPFGQEDRNVFRNALFNDNNVPSYGKYDDVAANMMNGDPLPYFQRLRVGSKLNNEVSIHPVTESKFYKAPEPMCEVPAESLFSRGWPVYPREQTE